MCLVSLKEVLTPAVQRGYAVGAFNVINLEFLNGIIDAAAEMRSPVILSIAEVHFPLVEIEQIAPAVKYCAAQAGIPVVLHLDHGLSIESVMRAIRCGFTSVMFDGSSYPLDKNIEETALVARCAHAAGVSVEAELGRIGASEGGEGGAAERAFFTDPHEAERFVRETGIDALAVSVGNVHGFYRGEPDLDFNLIATIRKMTGIPLVLHGGSGIPDEGFRRAIAMGIGKINIFTEMNVRAATGVRTILNNSCSYAPEILTAMKTGVREVVRERVRVFGSAGMAG